MSNKLSSSTLIQKHTNIMHYYCRGVEQCCVNEAGLGGMVPWVRCLQGTGVMFKLYRLPVQAAADQIWTNQKDNWTGEKYTHTTSFYINLWATIAYLLLNMPSTDFSYFQPAMRLIFQHRTNGSETVRKQVIHSIVNLALAGNFANLLKLPRTM